jgi:ATP-dependent DNA helicase RecG
VQQSQPDLALEDSITRIPGVGPERAKSLERLGIRTLGELLLHAPRKYEDRRVFSTIEGIDKIGIVSARGKIVELGLKKFGRGSKSLLLVVLDDGTGRLHCRWWNMPFMEKNFTKGQEVLVSGKVRDLKPKTIDHPEVEVIDSTEDETIHLKRIVPIYPLTEGISQRWMRGLVWRTLARTAIPESYPEEMLMGRFTHLRAIQSLHFPLEMWEPAAARERLALEEFIELQLQIQARRRALESKAPRLVSAGDNRLIKKFLPTLGFQLTNAQTEVLREIRQDFTNGIPMRRLLQGDVGSGKTVVAACAALMVLESGYDVALMSPTEILAEQHFLTFSRWFASLGVPVKIWTANAKSNLDSEPNLFERSAGGPAIIVGTHALIQKSFGVAKLGLAIIDEQHRFGVAQREQLVKKGTYPHLLIMTATPIPRTLGLTLYGDLDSSVIDELPPGRKPIKTFVRAENKLAAVWDFVRDRLGRGEQAYVVYSRVENEQSGKAVLKEVQGLRKEFAAFKVEALHGKLSGPEKDEIMRLFRANKVQMLVASSLIELGLDVPNATMMIVENAEQFGLAQLHQLRGRIGRGTKDSFCILISTAKNKEAEERLRVLEQTQDGFQIAEADMRFRGPGELLGQQQSGMPDLKFGNLVTDFDLVREARRIAIGLLKMKENSLSSTSNPSKSTSK